MKERDAKHSTRRVVSCIQCDLFDDGARTTKEARRIARKHVEEHDGHTVWLETTTLRIFEPDP